MNNAMSLKAKIRNIAKQKNIPAQVILQNYMFERLLVRLATSAYKDKFVLKGGMLVAALKYNNKCLLFTKCISCFLMGQQRNLLPFLMVTTLWGLVPQGLS